MRGSPGYPEGARRTSTVPQGLLLRPAIPNDEIFQGDGTYGPKANFKISLRELPDHGRFRVTVTAAKYDDGLLLDPGAAPQPPRRHGSRRLPRPEDSADRRRSSRPASIRSTCYRRAVRQRPPEVTLTLGERQFAAARAAAGVPGGATRRPASFRCSARSTGSAQLERIVFTPLAAEHELAKRFAAFEQRSPRLGVHMGFRRDCGSTLAPVGAAQTVSDDDALALRVRRGDPQLPQSGRGEGQRQLPRRRPRDRRAERVHRRPRHAPAADPVGRVRRPVLRRLAAGHAPQHLHRFGSEGRSGRPTRARSSASSPPARSAARSPPRKRRRWSAVFEKSFEGGARFQDSVKDALQVVLTSPQFLFLIENSSTPGRRAARRLRAGVEAVVLPVERPAGSRDC